METAVQIQLSRISQKNSYVWVEFASGAEDNQLAKMAELSHPSRMLYTKASKHVNMK